MKMRILLALALTATAHAGEIIPLLTLNDGTVYTNAEISSVTAAYAIVFYGDSSGVKVPLSKMPLSIQRQYNYDDAKATAEIDAAATKKQAAEQARQKALTVQQDAIKDQMFRYVDGDAVSISQFKQIHGQITQVIQNGVILDIYTQKSFPSAPVNYSQSISAAPTLPAASRWVPTGRMAFIQCPTAGLSDGQEWQGYCFNKGIFKYDTVNGSVATVLKYETGLSYLTKSDAVLKELPPLLRPQLPPRNAPDGTGRRGYRPAQ
jgi:hypothetical protein